MSKSSNHVPNLNKIMEEYAEGEQEAVQITQVEVEQEEVRAKARVEPEQPEDETRKRKRGAEETNDERIEKKASNWVLV